MERLNPAKWVMLKIVSEKETIYKILGSWYGGYAGSDSWRMNSGIKSIEGPTDDFNAYKVFGYSGSCYVCGLDNIGMSLYTNGVFEDLRKRSKEVGVTISVVPIEEFGDIV